MEAYARAQQEPAVGFIIEQLVDLVAERVAERRAAPSQSEADDWLDTRAAAEHLGVHCDTMRRLAADRSIPSEQDGPGCKRFFRRSDLDAWRCSERRHLRAVPAVAR